MAGMTNMTASPRGGSSDDGDGGAGDRLTLQQEQSGALHTQQYTHSSSSSSDALPWRVQSPPRSSGVRRRREESIEIEELDSDTMRQNSYNYFQRYMPRPSAPAYNISGTGIGNNSANAAFAFSAAAAEQASPVLRAGSSRKRQRTLADRLDELSIGGVDFFAHRRGEDSGGNRANGNRSSASSADAMMDGDSSSDERRDNEDDDDDDSAGARRELMVYGGVPSMKRFFFGSSRRKPMDRVFRHYAAVANQAASSAETNGNELVLFHRALPSPSPTPAFLVNLPYLSLSPQELEALTRQEKSKRASIVEISDKDGDDQDRDNNGPHGRRTTAVLSSSISGAYRSRSGSCSASSTSSPPFRALGVPRTDSMEDFDDVDMDGEGEPTLPHLSGDVSHSEWFLNNGEL